MEKKDFLRKIDSLEDVSKKLTVMSGKPVERNDRLKTELEIARDLDKFINRKFASQKVREFEISREALLTTLALPLGAGDLLDKVVRSFSGATQATDNKYKFFGEQNKSVEQLLNFFEKNPDGQFSAGELETALSLPINNAEYYLKHLIETGKVKKTEVKSKLPNQYKFLYSLAKK